MNARALTVVTTLVLLIGLVGFAVVRRASKSETVPAVQANGYDGQPTLGEAGAPVKVIMFENFLCEYCKAFEENIFPQLKRDYVDTGKAEVYYVNLAWGEEDAVRAGLAGECAFRQDEAAFWPYKTALFGAQGGEGETWATVETLVRVAQEEVPELNAEDLEACIRESRYQSEVDRDLALADYVGVQGTPSFVVGDEGLQDPTFADLAAAIDRNLGRN